ncbi:MAG: acetyl-CoA C-acetyltransferase [Gammaproteobacteria bacterium]|nr:acetyl-CoA C-acetyltransferase [Gammaproteobacteria bacterium]NNM13125.1 acetyl-CoA C-acetyltransferase [Gammaproteobacteria bacterium]
MSRSNAYKQEAVYIVDGARTPFLKARGKPGIFSASELAVAAGRDLLARQPFAPDALDEVVVGCAMPSADEPNIGRLIALRLGAGDATPGYTVMRNCASAMQAVDNAAKDIALGRSDLMLAGGTEAMSRAPLLFNDDMVNFLGDLAKAKKPADKLKAMSSFRPGHLKPVIGIMKGLTDPLVNLNMGQTCEVIAHKFDVTRKAMDEYAVRSHLRLAKAYDEDRMDEVIPLYNKAKVLAEDDGLRRDSNVEKLSTLKPFFDRKVGKVTAANSSQITDGSAMLLLASANAVEKYDLKPLGRLVDAQWAGLNAAEMGLGPVYASTPLLQRNNLDLSDVDYWELNEAFAGQVLACLAAWEDEAFCQTELGLDAALGTIDQDKLNIDGGAVSIGHPVGATGARLVLHALKVLQQTGQQRAIATLCIGGGLGGAMLLERV